MNHRDPDTLARAWRFAAYAHHGQTVPGTDLPYILHVGAVTMEVVFVVCHGTPVDQPDLALQCALLHDVLEDTPVTASELAGQFGEAVTAGVQALTKDPRILDKRQRMEDSLRRILAQPREIAIVKLADRIVNLQPPPATWSGEKIAAYAQEAERILGLLGQASDMLARRLAEKLGKYPSSEG